MKRSVSFYREDLLKSVFKQNEKAFLRPVRHYIVPVLHVDNVRLSKNSNLMKLYFVWIHYTMDTL